MSKNHPTGVSRIDATLEPLLTVKEVAEILKINPSDGYVRTVEDLKQAGIVSEKATKRAEMDTGNSGRRDFDPNDYPEHDERTWNDPRATEFIERVRKENRFQDKNSRFRETDAELLQAWTERSAPFNEPARSGNATQERGRKN